MALNKHILREMALKLLMVLAILFSAANLDARHPGPEKPVDKTYQEVDSRPRYDHQVVQYDLASYLNVEKGTDRLFSGLPFFTAIHSEFLAKLSCRTFHMMKAETLKSQPPVRCFVHFMKYNICHYLCLDDYPPSA